MIAIKASGALFIITLSISILQQNVPDFPFWPFVGSISALLLAIIGWLIKKKIENQDAEIEKLRIWKHDEATKDLQVCKAEIANLKLDVIELKEELKESRK